MLQLITMRKDLHLYAVAIMLLAGFSPMEITAANNNEKKCCLYEIRNSDVQVDANTAIFCGEEAKITNDVCPDKPPTKIRYYSAKLLNENKIPMTEDESKSQSSKHAETNSIKDGGVTEQSDPLQVSINAEKLTSGTLDSINPLRNSSNFRDKNNRTPGYILSFFIRNIIFPAAGLLLFLLIVYGGFTIVQGSVAGNDSVVSAGKQRVTAAVVGFLLLFSSYWLWQIVELALGLGATSS